MNWSRFSVSLPVDPQRVEPVALEVAGPLQVRAHDQASVVVRGWHLTQPAERRVHAAGLVRVRAAPYAVLHLLNVAGPVNLAGLTQGQVRLENVAGPVRVQHVAEVYIGEVQGPLRAVGVRQHFRLEELAGWLTVEGLPQVLQAQVDGWARLRATALAGQQVRLRAAWSVHVQIPAQAAVQGRIEAPQIWVDLDAQTHRGSGVLVLRAANPDLVLEVSSDRAVYLGPQPSTLLDMMGRGAFLTRLRRWLGRRSGASAKAPVDVSANELAPSSPASPASEDDWAAARRRVLDLLATGRLSAKEAAALLDALEER